MSSEHVFDLIPSRYDLAATGSFLGYDQFRKRFGTELDQDGNPRISPAWQAGI
jgi:SP family general alpha glucoside:H+ symporter-like MFS transporter